MRSLILVPLGAALALAASPGCASIPRGAAAIDSVDIQGNQAVSGADITEKMATTASPRFLGLFPGVVYEYEIFNRGILQRDLERVARYYRARGYYDAVVRVGRVQHRASDHVDVTVVVDEGPPVRIREARVEGLRGLPAEDADAARAAVTARLTHGQPFEEEPYREAEAAMKRALTDRGYAWATVGRRADVDLPGRYARVFFDARPGPRATFGPVSIEGLGELPEAPVRRALGVAPGDVYSTAAIDRAKRAVLDLGTFSAVEIVPDLAEPSLPGGVVPLRVRVQPQKLRSATFGGGLEIDATRTDAHVHLGWEHRNLFGGFRRFTVDLEPGVALFPTRLPTLEAPSAVLLEERLRASLHQPGFLEARTSGVITQELDVYPMRLSSVVDPRASVLGYVEYRGSLGLDRSFGRLFVASTYSLQYTHPFAYQGAADPRLLSLVVSSVDLLVRLDLRDDGLRPHRGVFLQNDLQFAGLGGDARDVRLQPEVRGYLPLGRTVTLAARGTVGLLFPLDYRDAAEAGGRDGVRDIELMALRGFFSGGPSSNRGYPLRGIGPHGPVSFFTPDLPARAASCRIGDDAPRCAVALGGLSLWEASIELRFPVHGPLGGAAFCDASDVSARRADLRLAYPHLSCGLGLRYETPIGPVRLDVGYRIPGLQVARGTDPRIDADPGTLQGLPFALAFGIGEAF